MNILVTGYKGFIGKHMVKHLQSHRHTVFGWEWGDQNWNDIDLFLSLDHAIHLGAISSTTSTDINAIIRQNYLFTKYLVNTCSDFDIPISIASSASVYGIHADRFKETDIPAPANPYAWSKFMVEEYCLAGNFRIPIHLFRYFNVYGAGEEHKGDQASPYHKFTTQAIDSGVVKVFEGSEAFRRDFVPVEYVVEVHEKFLHCGETGIWNIGTGTATSFMDVATTIANQYNAKVVEIPMPPALQKHYQPYTQADVTKLHHTLQLLHKDA